MAFNSIGLVTGDKTVTLKIFSEGLGLTFQEFGKGEHLETTTASGVRIMLDTVTLMREINPDYKFLPEACSIHLGFECSKPAEVDDLCSKLKAAGAAVEKEMAWVCSWSPGTLSGASATPRFASRLPASSSTSSPPCPRMPTPRSRRPEGGPRRGVLTRSENVITGDCGNAGSSSDPPRPAPSVAETRVPGDDAQEDGFLSSLGASWRTSPAEPSPFCGMEGDDEGACDMNAVRNNSQAMLKRLAALRRALETSRTRL
eukprot:s2466_g8.t1